MLIFLSFDYFRRNDHPGAHIISRYRHSYDHTRADGILCISHRVATPWRSWIWA